MSTVENVTLEELASALPRIGGRKSELVYVALQKAILFRVLLPNQQLLEQELAGRFGCSQGTIREALLRLADDGLVLREGYRGTRVTETSLAEASELVRIRLSIERGVARRLATADLSPHRAGLEDILARMSAAHERNDQFESAALDRRFHSVLTETAGMPLLCPLLSRCTLHIHRFTLSGLEVPRQFYQEAGIDSEHRALLNTLTAGDADKAERAISDHIALVLKRWAPSLHRAVGDAVFAAPRTT